MASQKDAEHLLAQIRLEMRDLLDTSGGRYLIWNIIGHCNLFTPEESLTSQAAHFNEGKRWVGNRVLDLLFTHAPEKFMLMREEGAARDAILGLLEPERENEDG